MLTRGRRLLFEHLDDCAACTEGLASNRPAPRLFTPHALREGPCGGVAKRGEAGASPDGGRVLTGRGHQPACRRCARALSNTRRVAPPVAGASLQEGNISQAGWREAPGWRWCRARRRAGCRARRAREAARSGRRDVGEISGRGRRDKREVYSGPEPAAQATTQVGEFSPGVVLCGPAAPV